MIQSRGLPATLLVLAIALVATVAAEAQRPDKAKVGGTVAVTGAGVAALK